MSKHALHECLLLNLVSLEHKATSEQRPHVNNGHKFGVLKFECTLGSHYGYNRDNEIPLSDSLSVQNLSVHTSLSVHCTDDKAWA